MVGKPAAAAALAVAMRRDDAGYGEGGEGRVEAAQHARR
jgi:hypothetical protein